VTGETSQRPKVVVLQHAACEPLGTLHAPFEEAFELTVLEAFSDPPRYRHAVERLVHGAGPDGLVALGGPMSVYDHNDVEGLDDSLRLIRTAVHADIPILGVCLGAQLLAFTLGAQVWSGTKLGKRREIGWSRVSLTDRGRVDPLFHGFDATRPVFHWHGDTFDLPEGAWLLASTRLYPQQAFRWGRWAYGLQFHIEVTPALVREWADVYGSEISALDHVDAAGLVAGAKTHAAGLSAKSRVVADRFVECVRESTRQRRSG
jgi:GMP synthase (glutamine-hydrolysing)